MFANGNWKLKKTQNQRARAKNNKLRQQNQNSKTVN